MSTRSRPDLSMFTGTNSADEMYDRLFVDTGLVSGKEKLPSGDRGFNLSKAMRHQARKHGSKEPEIVENNGLKGPSAIRLPNWTHGWGNYLEEQYGHRNVFAALAALKSEQIDEELHEFAEDSMDDAESVLEKVATKTTNVDEGKQVNSGVVQNATPILIDPDFINTVRSKAPILNWVDIVAQGGFTASYNAVTARDQMLNWASESDVRDLSSNTGSAFTLTNQDKDMKIGYGVLDISDFAAQAQSSLDFMDLEGTSMEIWGQGYGIEEAEMLLYGDPDGGLSDGSPHDTNAPEGLYDLANDANTSYTVDKSTVDLSGDKALFKDIKQEVLSLAKDSNVAITDIGLVTSYDVFNALEDEAEINVRLDAFDGSVNFGRDPAGPTTLSIAGAPILPDPNVRNQNYGSGEYDGNVGDVFLFDRTTYQRRALQPLASTDLGQLGLARRIAMFQYETPVDLAQGERIRVLENYSVTAI